MDTPDALVLAARSWDEFYRERRDVPFLADRPDESLAAWLEAGLLPPGRALDVGCGPGRNALHLARRGFRAEGIDLSPEAIAWARRRAAEAGLEVPFEVGDFLSAPLEPLGYDLVVDGGVLHHVRPSLRPAWLERAAALLRPGGHLALTAFAPESGAPVSEVDDDRSPASRTGWAFTMEGLNALLERYFVVEESRRMRELDAAADRMGVGFLWVARARRR